MFTELGIAPTLITTRNAKARAKISDVEFSEPISRISFKENEQEAGVSVDDTDLQTTASNKEWQARTV
ncbi:hypothetical protein CVT25_014568 [Psilocybe cyanescens]|uniref:Uncharacterized protein n=1 Tax=Psilocybe cyanescens TaxID=93625 RepID=A0A409WRE6_PSICY|nr:hypothetical protein CVT25_014568 [Psilocybe cyanescens]